MNVCDCYHTSKPIHDTTLFQQHLVDNAADILDSEKNRLLSTDDLNTLNNSDIPTHLGLDQIVNLPIHGVNLLDLCITNRPDMFNLQVGQSLISTKRKAVVVNAKSAIIQTNQCTHRQSMQVREYSPLTVRLLRQSLAVNIWNGIIAPPAPIIAHHLGAQLRILYTM